LLGVDEAAETVDAGVIKCSMEATESGRYVVTGTWLDGRGKSLWYLRGMGVETENTVFLAPGSDDVGGVVWG
jgi:hypothetical protein